MSLTWRIIIIIIVAVLISGIGYWFFLRYQNIKGPQASAIEAIDENVVFFLQSNDIRASLYKLTAESQYWQVLLQDSYFNDFQDQFFFLDSLITSHSGFNEIFEMNTFTLSYNRNREGTYSFIFMQELPPGDYDQDVESFIKDSNGQQSIVLKKEYKKAKIITVNLSGPEELFFYSVYKGLFIGSFDEQLINNTIDRLKSKDHLLEDDHFARIHATAGKNVDANVYIKIPNFMDWCGLYLTEAYAGFAQKLANFGYWTEMDLLVNDKDLLLNGYTIVTDSAKKILNRFRYPPQHVKAPEILPYDISWMMHWGLDDFTAYLSANQEQLGIKDQLLYYDQTYGLDLMAVFASWVGNEIVLAALPEQSGGYTNVVAIHSKDVVKAVLGLGEMEEKANRKNRTQAEEFIHRDYNIRKLGLGSLFSNFLGEPFPDMKKCYYVALKDYILFSQNDQSLVRIIDHFYNQKTLFENANYRAFSDNISDRSNIYIYCNTKNPDPGLDKVFQSVSGANLLRNLKTFDGLALQFSYINGMFYTNMFLSYNPDYKEIKVTNWESELGSEMVGQPHFVRNHRNGKMNIVVFDRSNTMYLLDHVGRIQWQMPLIEAPTGNVYLVDYYGNDKYQYLFNTRNYVYVVDLNGNYVADFPRKLVTHSTNPIAAFDYDGSKDYRLVMALEDNKVYNFDKQLENVRGWSKVQASATISQRIQHLTKGGKDYLFISDDNGTTKITDRRGQDRGSPSAKVNKARNSSYYINRTNNKGVFLTTDEKGKVVYLNEKGKIKRTTFGEFSAGHFFFYEDFDQDDHMDFIYVDGNNLIVYNRFKKVIGEHHFEEMIIKCPVMFQWAGRFYIGVIFNVAGEIRIYDLQGRRFADQYIQGDKPFVVGNLENGRLNLITGKGEKVMNFQLN